MGELRIKDDYLAAVLRGEEKLLLDGGMGTLLMAAGLFRKGHVADILCIENPEGVTNVQKGYVDAGTQLLITNTFNSNPEKIAEEGYEVEDIFTTAVKCARDAGARYVGGDIGPLGVMLEPYGDLELEEAYELFAREVRAADAAGADMICIETMMSIDEALAAVKAAKDNCDLPVYATMSYSQNGKTMFGDAPADATRALCEAGVDIVGTNCSCGPEEILPIVQEIVAAATVPVSVKPNAGLPETIDGELVYNVTPEQFGQAYRAILDAGATVVGGCCGTNPEFIKELAKLL